MGMTGHLEGKWNLSRGFVSVPNRLIEEWATLTLQPRHLALCAVLLSHATATEHPVVTTKRIAGEIGWTNRNTRGVSRELEDAGLLKRTYGHRGKASMWDITGLVELSNWLGEPDPEKLAFPPTLKAWMERKFWAGKKL